MCLMCSSFWIISTVQWVNQFVFIYLESRIHALFITHESLEEKQDVMIDCCLIPPYFVLNCLDWH